MVALHRMFAALALGLVVTAIGAPALARERWYDNGGYRISLARAAAIHTCSVKVSRFFQYAWNNWDSYIYRACMTEHDQPE